MLANGTPSILIVSVHLSTILEDLNRLDYIDALKRIPAAAVGAGFVYIEGTFAETNPGERNFELVPFDLPDLYRGFTAS